LNICSIYRPVSGLTSSTSSRGSLVTPASQGATRRSSISSPLPTDGHRTTLYTSLRLHAPVVVATVRGGGGVSTWKLDLAQGFCLRDGGPSRPLCRRCQTSLAKVNRRRGHRHSTSYKACRVQCTPCSSTRQAAEPSCRWILSRRWILAAVPVPRKPMVELS
jgi:hypothetical protein